MKLVYLLFAGIILASCSQEAEPKNEVKTEEQNEDSVEVSNLDGDEVEVEVKKSYDYYAGSIGLYGEDVLVEISIEDLTISGGYWYLKHGKRIKLEGKKSAKANEWKIEESVKGVVTGYMTLQQEGDSLFGQWYAPGKKSELQRVALKRVLKGHEGKLNPEFETYERKKTITMYDGTENREEEASDDLRLIRIGDYVLFQYFVIGSNAHVGHINGLAKITKENEAVFKGEESCALTISFGANEATVLEDDCSYYRGMRAYFDGTLKKVN